VSDCGGRESRGGRGTQTPKEAPYAGLYLNPSRTSNEIIKPFALGGEAAANESTANGECPAETCTNYRNPSASADTFEPRPLVAWPILLSAPPPAAKRSFSPGGRGGGLG
jgi:hypothetical protein